MRIGYYPGCSLHATAREFDESLQAVAARARRRARTRSTTGRAAAPPRRTPPTTCSPWRCRRATWRSPRQQGHDERAGALRRLLQPPRHGPPRDRARRGAGRAGRARCSSGPSPTAWRCATWSSCCASSARPIRAEATRPLTGLKVACYYGCLLVRPAEVCGFDDPEQPTSMEEVVRATGATPVDLEHAARVLRRRLLARRAPARSSGSAAPSSTTRARPAPRRSSSPARCATPTSTSARRRCRAGRGAAAGALPHRARRAGARASTPDALGLQRHFVPTPRPAGRRRRRSARRGGGADGPHRRLRLPLRREHRPHRRLRAGRRGARASMPGRRPLGRLQVHVLRPGPDPHQAGDRREEARRRRRRGLLAAHAREDLPPRLRRRRAEPVPVRDGQHPRALLLDPRGPRRGHRQGDRPRAHHRREGQAQPAAADDPHPGRPSGPWSSAAASPASRRRSTSPTAAPRWSWSRRSPPSAAT